MLRVSLMYEFNREQVVVVGPKMQAAFAHTSLGEIPTDLIQLPYPCFYLATPESEGLDLWGGERTGWHKCAGCYVCKNPWSNTIMILAWGMANDKSVNPLDDASFWFQVDLDRWSKESDLESQFESITTDTLMQRSIDEIEVDSREIESDQRGVPPRRRTSIDLDHAVNSILNNAQGDVSDLGLNVERAGAVQAARLKETGRKLLRVVINTILYMNSSGADLSDPKDFNGERARLGAEIKRLKNPRKTKGRSLQRKLDDLTKSRIVWVGPTIEQDTSDETDFTSDGKRRRVSGHIRRGHWHTFLFGPRKKEGVVIPKEDRVHTSKWMPPMWVGSAKEAAPGSRVYGLKEPTVS